MIVVLVSVLVFACDGPHNGASGARLVFHDFEDGDTINPLGAWRAGAADASFSVVERGAGPMAHCVLLEDFAPGFAEYAIPFADFQSSSPIADVLSNVGQLMVSISIQGDEGDTASLELVVDDIGFE
ncbi:MAG: hypothetical protein ACOCU9_00495 [Spirochaetota bacterium]